MPLGLKHRSLTAHVWVLPKQSQRVWGHRARLCRGLASQGPAGSSNHGAPRLTLSFFKPSFWVSVNCTCSSCSRRCRMTTSLSFLSKRADVSSRSLCRSSSSFNMSAAGQDRALLAQSGAPASLAAYPLLQPAGPRFTLHDAFLLF